MKKPKILVTGGNGQLARSIRDFQSRYSGFNFHFVPRTDLNISDTGAVSSIIEMVRPDYIINCAAYTQVDAAESNKEEAYSINADGIQNIGKCAETSGIKVIHISTDYVYHSVSDRPLSESDETLPIGVYAKSKLQGEQLLRETGCKYVILRTSWVYSQYGKNFVKTMLRLADSGKEIRVVDDQIGCPTYASDLTHIILTIIEKDFNEPFINNQIYNFCNKGETSFYEFARAIFLLAGKEVTLTPIPSKDYPLPARRPGWSVLNTDKISEEIGFEMKAWQKSLVECLEKLKHETT